MIVVDIETTGTDPRVHSILSIGAIDFDNPNRRFSEECRAFIGAKIEAEATEVNGVGEEEAFDPKKQSDKELVEHFFAWMMESNDHMVAGQNPHFDTGFLQETARRYHLNFPVPQRVIDLHSATWTHMKLQDKTPPLEHNRSGLNSETICSYVGLPAEAHPHLALNGALWETEAFSRIFNNKPLLEEFKGYAIPWQK